MCNYLSTPYMDLNQQKPLSKLNSWVCACDQSTSSVLSHGCKFFCMGGGEGGGEGVLAWCDVQDTFSIPMEGLLTHPLRELSLCLSWNDEGSLHDNFTVRNLSSTTDIVLLGVMLYYVVMTKWYQWHFGILPHKSTYIARTLLIPATPLGLLDMFLIKDLSLLQN